MKINGKLIESIIENSIFKVLHEDKKLVIHGQGDGDAPVPDMGGAPMPDPNATPMPDPNAAPIDNSNAAPAGPNVAPEAPVGGGDDEFMTIYNGLNDDHQHAVKKYAEAMERMETEIGSTTAPDMGGEDPNAVPSDPNAMPMQESFIFTKAQLKRINEELGYVEKDASDDRGVENKKKEPGYRTKSPFEAPKFDKK